MQIFFGWGSGNADIFLTWFGVRGMHIFFDQVRGMRIFFDQVRGMQIFFD